MADDREEILTELRALLRAVWRDHPPDDIETDATLSHLGVQSSAMLTFLVRTEQQFGFRWDPDVSAGALGNLGSIADIVRERLRAKAPADADSGR